MGTHKIKADLDVDGEVQGTSLDINGAANIDGLLDVNTGTTNTVAIFESTDDKAFIKIKDNDTDVHLIAKDNKFSIGESSSDYDNFKIDISSGDATFAGGIDFSNNKGLTWAGSHSVRVESNVLKLNASGGIQLQSDTTFSGNVLIPSNLQHVGDDNNEISFGTDTQDFRTNNVSRLDISNSGVRFGGTGARITQVEDNDSLGTSDTKLATQGNIKAYVDSAVSAAGGGDVTLAGAQTFTGVKTFGTTTKLQFRDSNAYINSPDSNDIEVAATVITLDASNQVRLEGDTVVTGGITADQINLQDGGDYITFYGNDAGQHSISSRDASGTAGADDLRINSYGAVHVNLDSNSNNGSDADFTIGHHGSNDGTITNLFTVNGENGNVTLTGIVLDGNTITGVNDSGEFDDDDSHIMTSAGVLDKIQSEISNLVDSSPAALNTLNELAAAINDDANFSTTITNSIATKLPLAGGTMTGNIAHASDFTLDVGGDIILDADGAEVILADGGTQFANLKHNSGDFEIKSLVQDKDIKFIGNDNNSDVTALTLDMSDAGTAIFNNGVYIPNHILHVGDGNTKIGFPSADTFEVQTGGSARLTVNDSTATFAGNIAVGNNNITGVNEIEFDDGFKLFGGGNDNYLKAKAANSANGGIIFQDGDSETMGYIYWDGASTANFGFLDATGSWAVKCRENEYVQLLYDNATKLQTKTDGVDITGELQADTLDIDGNADISGDLSGVDTLTAQYGRFTSTGDASVSSTTHGIQVGATNSTNIIIDNNEIMARNNGAVSALNFNPDGETVNFHSNTGNSTTISPTAGISSTSLTVSGNINANGNIVGDDGTAITNITSIGADAYGADADSSTRFDMTASDINCLVQDTDVFQVTETDFVFDSAIKTSIKKRKFAKTTNTDANADGDIVYFGGTTSMDAGKIYFFNSSGNWQLADADAESTSNGMLGVALGSASDTNGVLIRGMVTLDHDPGTISNALFLSTTAGTATATAPSGNGDIVRVIGYCLDSTNGQIYFNPDGTFVEVTA